MTMCWASFIILRRRRGTREREANNQTDKGYSIPGYFDGEFYVGLGAGSTGTLQSPEQGFAVSNFFFTSASPRTGVEPSPEFPDGQ